MIRSIAIAATAALMAACASSGGDTASSSTTAPRTASATAPGASGATAPADTYTDAQVQAFVAARASISRLTPGTTAEAQAANQRQIGEILAQNNMTPDVYNAIGTRAQNDQTLANRISAASISGELTDVQLQAFVRTANEIQPLNQQLASATPEQRTALGEQIRASLQRNNMTIDQFNGIAARAQSDPTLAARINTIRAEQAATQPEG